MLLVGAIPGGYKGAGDPTPEVTMSKKPAKKASKSLDKKEMKKTRGGSTAAMLSSLSKSQHDTSQTIIQNIRG
jgi:hypothetical protein